MKPTFSLAALTLGCAFCQTVSQPVRAVTDPGIVTTRQAITPAGVPSVFQGRVFGVAWGSASEIWVLHASDLYRLDWKKNEVRERLAHGGSPGAQSLQVDSSTGTVYLGNSVREGARGATKARLASVKNGAVQSVAASLGSFQPGAISIANRTAVLPLAYENKLAVIDLETGQVRHRIETGIAPFASAIDSKATVAYVSNLGGRPPKGSEFFAAPMQKPLEKVTVDARGIASTGTITRVDLATGQVTHTIPVGLHPTGLAWHQATRRLFVANGNSESVTMIDTQSNQPVGTIDLQPFSEKVRGIAPTAVAVDTTGKTLYVACGGINAVAVVDIASGKLQGMIPTGWYPNGLALDPSGTHLAVTSLLGPGSAWRDEPSKRFVHSYRGSVAVLPLPDKAQLASYTTAVAENNRLRLTGSSVETRNAASGFPAAVPARSGDASLIENIVFIVKENRTYDQVLGDISKGNGDPSMVMFGRDITPNQHKLAEEFVLLDNFFATGGNSADGHQWLTQANETEYCLYPGYQGRSYPFDGTDPMAYSSGGFIWDYALAKGRSVKVYGEYAGRMNEPGNKARAALLERWKQGADFSKDWSIRAPIEPLNKILAAHFPSYTNAIPDVVRAQIFLADLKRFEQEGKLPNLILLQMPSDHTFGTSPGVSTPKAMVADNDLAVGQVVEALSKSKFWPKMAIFIVEDDAQNGVDHVDGHRTTAFVASPYTRRGHVDSTFYSHQSMLKTMELMLGLPTMSIFDLIATDMRASFTDKPDLTPFTSVPAKHDLFETNPEVKALNGKARQGAIDSARMNWSVPDAVPTERLNRILWGQIMGWQRAYPTVPRRAFSPLAIDIDDDDREEGKAAR